MVRPGASSMNGTECAGAKDRHREPDNSDMAETRTSMFVPAEPLPRRRVIHRQYYGPKDAYESWVVAHSLGPVKSVGPLLIDQVAIPQNGTAVAGSYNGYMWLDTQLGACPEQLLGPPLHEDGQELAHRGLLLELGAGLLDRGIDVLGRHRAVVLAHQGAVEEVDLVLVCLGHVTSEPPRW